MRYSESYWHLMLLRTKRVRVLYLSCSMLLKFTESVLQSFLSISESLFSRVVVNNFFNNIFDQDNSAKIDHDVNYGNLEC